MIKATAGNYLFLGIDEENIRRLLNKKPIMFEGKPYGCNKDIVIFAGKDPKDLLRELKSFGLKLPEVPNIQRTKDDADETKV